VNAESGSHKKKNEMEYLADSETKTLLDEPDRFFETKVEVKRIRHEKHQTFATLTYEEALLS
jgi:hypothetical protein